MNTLTTIMASSKFKASFAVVGSMMSYAFGVGNIELWILIWLLVFFDVVTGFLKAKKLKQEITSSRMSNKIISVACYCVIIGVTNAIVHYIELTASNVPVEIGQIARGTACLYIISLELKSILENLNQLGHKLGFLEDLIQRYIGNKQK